MANHVTRSSGTSAKDLPPLEAARAAFDSILAKVNKTSNDVANMDLGAALSGHPAGPVGSAIKLGTSEVKALIAELGALPAAQAQLILSDVLPERMKPAQHGAIVLTEKAAATLTEAAAARGLAVTFESKPPVLPMAMPMGPLVAPKPSQGGAIEGVAAIAQIKSSAPVDPKLVARINEISSAALQAVGGQGKNVVLSVANILDAIAPVTVSLLPAAGDSAEAKSSKAATMAALKQDFKAGHLKDTEFVHQLQVIHAQLAQFKELITMGNEIVLDQGTQLRPGVQDAVEKGFGAKVQVEDMSGAPEGAAANISARIEAATTAYETQDDGSKKKLMDGLKEVVKPDMVQGLEMMSVSTLVAVLGWRHIFDQAKTKEETVTSAAGGADKKSLMTFETGYRQNPATQQHEEIPDLAVAEKNGFVFVKLPYDDKIDHGESMWGTPPSRVYRIVGAPNVGATERHTKLASLIPALGGEGALGLEYQDRPGKVTLARVQAEGEADPLDLLAKAGVDATSWAFPLVEGAPLVFSKGVHRGAAADTEKRSIVQFATALGLEFASIPQPKVPFELRTDVPYYNAVVVDLLGPNGTKVPLKVAEWTVEDFGAVKDPPPEEPS